MKLFVNALIKFLIGLLLVALLIFLPAGTLAYPGGLLFLCLLFVPMLLMGIVMLARARDLLAKRLDAKEKQVAQKGVQSLAGLVFMAGFVLAGLDFRFGWSDVPLPVVIAASVIFLIGYGLYGIVRHPMYLASVLMFLSIPLVMGSWYALIPFAFYPLLMVVRILDEEKLLTAELSGYEEYKRKVKFRLIPFIW